MSWKRTKRGVLFDIVNDIVLRGDLAEEEITEATIRDAGKAVPVLFGTRTIEPVVVGWQVPPPAFFDLKIDPQIALTGGSGALPPVEFLTTQSIPGLRDGVPRFMLIMRMILCLGRIDKITRTTADGISFNLIRTPLPRQGRDREVISYTTLGTPIVLQDINNPDNVNAFSKRQAWRNSDRFIVSGRAAQMFGEEGGLGHIRGRRNFNLFTPMSEVWFSYGETYTPGSVAHNERVDLGTRYYGMTSILLDGFQVGAKDPVAAWRITATRILNQTYLPRASKIHRGTQYIKQWYPEKAIIGTIAPATSASYFLIVISRALLKKQRRELLQYLQQLPESPETRYQIVWLGYIHQQVLSPDGDFTWEEPAVSTIFSKKVEMLGLISQFESEATLTDFTERFTPLTYLDQNVITQTFVNFFSDGRLSSQPNGAYKPTIIVATTDLIGEKWSADEVKNTVFAEYRGLSTYPIIETLNFLDYMNWMKSPSSQGFRYPQYTQDRVYSVSYDSYNPTMRERIRQRFPELADLLRRRVLVEDVEEDRDRFENRQRLAEELADVGLSGVTLYDPYADQGGWQNVLLEREATKAEEDPTAIFRTAFVRGANRGGMSRRQAAIFDLNPPKIKLLLWEFFDQETGDYQGKKDDPPQPLGTGAVYSLADLGAAYTNYYETKFDSDGLIYSERPLLDVTPQFSYVIDENNSPTFLKTLHDTISTTESFVEAISFLSEFGQTMNPVHALRETLVNPEWGFGYPETQIDDVGFRKAADTAHAEKLDFCHVHNRLGSPTPLLEMILKYLDGVVFYDAPADKVKLTLVRGDYDVTTLPHFDESSISEITDYQRQHGDQTLSSLTVKYFDAINDSEETVELQNLAIGQRRGKVEDAPLSFPGCATRTAAVRVAERELYSVSQPVISFTANINSATPINLGDVILVSFKDLGISRVVMRVSKIDYGNGITGGITVYLIQDIYSLASSFGEFLLEEEPTVPETLEDFSLIRDLVFSEAAPQDIFFRLGLPSILTPQRWIKAGIIYKPHLTSVPTVKIGNDTVSACIGRLETVLPALSSNPTFTIGNKILIRSIVEPMGNRPVRINDEVVLLDYNVRKLSDDLWEASVARRAYWDTVCPPQDHEVGSLVWILDATWKIPMQWAGTPIDVTANIDGVPQRERFNLDEIIIRNRNYLFPAPAWVTVNDHFTQRLSLDGALTVKLRSRFVVGSSGASSGMFMLIRIRGADGTEYYSNSVEYPLNSAAATYRVFIGTDVLPAEPKLLFLTIGATPASWQNWLFVIDWSPTARERLGWSNDWNKDWGGSLVRGWDHNWDEFYGG